MGRAPCCDMSVKKGPWTPEEDELLIEYMRKNGPGKCWRYVPKLAGLNRCGKSCRLRWTNYLHPDIKRGFFSKEEEHLIIQLHSVLGNKWSSIATRLPGRTDNEIKNHWNTHLRKRLLRAGIDPVTHISYADHHHRLLAAASLPLGILSAAGLSNQDVQSSARALPNHHQQYLQGIVNGSAMSSTSRGGTLRFSTVDLQQGFKIPPAICVDGLLISRPTDVNGVPPSILSGATVRVPGELNGTVPPEEKPSPVKCGTSTDTSVSSLECSGTFDGLESILEGIINTDDLSWKELLEQFSLLD